ncbi:hypothetical protein [Nocardiopsis xinjiangensis]|uniref:hypothetical protein n=1 Tax=Nocardiopsis xinjiangensis TaxID=124285 RepID=UPI000348B1E1|nr:hypothetical protein [Nocardiopsis xinjiangensis]
MDTPGTAWLIWVLVTIAVPIVVIFIVLGLLRWSRMRAQEAVRSEEYWEETPDGQRYPTGYERMYDPEARRAATRGEYPGDEEPGAADEQHGASPSEEAEPGEEGEIHPGREDGEDGPPGTGR